MRLRTDRRGRLVAALLLTTSLSSVVSCGHDPVDPGPTLEVVVAGGDGQYANAGAPLTAPLEALVRRVDTGVPETGVDVEWTVESGDATLSSKVVSSDENGYVRVTVHLGTRPDTVHVRAAARIQPTAGATFTAYVAVRPVIESLTPARVRAGDTVTMSGSGYSANTTQNVVLFSGIRGRVVSASAGELRVEVPPCLPTRGVQVTSQLGALVSEAVPLDVEDAGHLTTLAPGGYVDIEEADAIGCLRLPGGDATYLVTALSSGTVGAARYNYVLRGLDDRGTVGLGTPRRGAGGPRAAADRAQGRVAAPFATTWEASLRENEDRLVRAAGAPVAPSVRAPGPLPIVPAVGDRRSFEVLNASSTFDEVEAVARVVGAHAVIYVDVNAPAGGYTDTDLQVFSESFDDFIYPTDTGVFGVPSDLDANQRIVILFTPTVNSLTPRGASGFIGGFFYGLDLLDQEGSNHAEIFYAIVPDSVGAYSDVREKGKVLRVVPSILAHEFQHMIHFNERVLKLHADGTEALWLSEGMAQMAEDLVAGAYADAGDALTAALYRDGDEDRARRYLTDPSAVSTIVSTGQGSLQERGAGWLFTLYLWDQDRGGDILSRLTKSTLSGSQNVAWATGRAWKEVFADWSTALYLDGSGVGPGTFSYPNVDLRGRLTPAKGTYPLAPDTLPAGDFVVNGSLWSSSMKHYIVEPSATGSVVVRLGGDAGGNAPADAGLRLRVVRLH